MNKVVFILGAVVLVAAAFVAWDIINENSLSQYDTPVQIGSATLKVELAATPAERATGLSGRKVLPQDTGVLFIFEGPTTPSFWMKDMQFPIDIIWINKYKQVVGIERRVSPDTYPQTFSPPEEVQYVLEVNAGWAAENRVRVGDLLKVQ